MFVSFQLHHAMLMLKHRYLSSSIIIHPNRYYRLPCGGAVCTAELVGGTITKIRVHDSEFGLPGGMAVAHWPLRQRNSTKNTSFQKSSPESSPVQNPGPVQGIVLPQIIVATVQLQPPSRSRSRTMEKGYILWALLLTSKSCYLGVCSIYPNMHFSEA